MNSSVKTNIQDTSKNLSLFVRWVLACLLVLYSCSGIFSISSNEIGILQRFGRVVNHNVQPGIHFALPWPVDRVQKVPVKMVNRILIDDFSSAYAGATSRTFADITGLDSYCITGDNNLVNISCVIQYTIVNPVDFVFHIKEPELILRNMASGTIIHSIAETSIDDVLTTGKFEIARYIKQKLQTRLDDINSGLSITFVELSEIKPPDRAQQAFSDVVKADIDRIKMINDAGAYRNERIPEAKAMADRILQDGAAYKKEVVLRAEGDVGRFLSLLEQNREKGDSTRNMLYRETLREVLKNVDKKRVMVLDNNKEMPVKIKLFSQ